MREKFLLRLRDQMSVLDPRNVFFALLVDS